MFSSRNRKYICHDMGTLVSKSYELLVPGQVIEISYFSSGKWDNLDKSGMVFLQL